MSQVNYQSDYKEIFGKQYVEALNYFNKNQWITTTLINNKIDPCFAKSIVFPELIRYSFIRDKMEIQALKTLYVQYGQKYANFSVGRFQIKPTFAHEVEKDIINNQELRKDKKIEGLNIYDTPEARLARVKRLEKDDWQIQYLIWFIKLTDFKFKNIHWNSEDEKVRFYAAAYNCGYTNCFHYLMKMKNKDFFHTTILKSQLLYNYSGISHYFWQNCRN